MKREHFFLWIGVLVFVGLFFQNCSKGEYEVEVDEYESLTRNLESVSGCQFNGFPLTEGQSVTAYLNSTPEFTNGSCVAETRYCRNNVLTGTYVYARCQSGEKSCLFNGRTLANGETVKAYRAPAVANCQEETRTCMDGRLTGTYQYAACASNLCLVNGKTLYTNDTFTYFTQSSVPYGSSCQPLTGRCYDNGIVKGGAGEVLNPAQIYGSCTTRAATCNFGGRPYNAGETFTYYTTAQATACAARTGKCSDTGQLIDAQTSAPLGTSAYTGCENVPPPVPTTSPDSCLLSQAINQSYGHYQFQDRKFYGYISVSARKVQELYNQGMSASQFRCDSAKDICVAPAEYFDYANSGYPTYGAGGFFGFGRFVQIPANLDRFPPSTQINAANREGGSSTCNCVSYNFSCAKLTPTYENAGGDP